MYSGNHLFQHYSLFLSVCIRYPIRLGILAFQLLLKSMLISQSLCHLITPYMNIYYRDEYCLINSCRFLFRQVSYTFQFGAGYVCPTVSYLNLIVAFSSNKKALLAQSVARMTLNHKVRGSSPLQG